MTVRERILMTIGGQISDRVSVSPFVQEEFLTYLYPSKSRVDRVYDALKCAREFGFDLMARPKNYEKPFFLSRSCPNWNVRVDESTSDGKFYRRTIISTPKRDLARLECGPDIGVATSGLHLSTLEYFLKDVSDIEAFVEYMPSLTEGDEGLMFTQVSEWNDAVDEEGLVVPWGWGSVFNHAAEYRNVEDLMMDAYTEPDAYSALMTAIARGQSEFNAALVRAGIACVGLQGNIANGSMVGYDFFKANIQSYEQRVIDSIKNEGAFVLYHNCGNARALYRNYVEMGLDVWETIASAPQGDNDLAEAKNTIGKQMCIMGNIDQVNFLKTATPDDVAKETERIISLGKRGGKYIFAASDYLEKNTPIENLKALIEVAKVAGRY